MRKISHPELIHHLVHLFTMIIILNIHSSFLNWLSFRRERLDIIRLFQVNYKSVPELSNPRGFLKPSETGDNIKATTIYWFFIDFLSKFPDPSNPIAVSALILSLIFTWTTKCPRVHHPSRVLSNHPKQGIILRRLR
jgi:hypothetical protein